MDLNGKCVLLGVSGGIAAYKMANVASALRKLGADVEVIMTRNATQFITPLTFETLTGHKCMVDTFDRDFKFEVNSNEERWGKPAISGRILEQLARPGPGEAVFLDVRGGTAILIEPAMLVDLNAPGVERFYNAPRPPVEIEIIVELRD